MQRGATLESLTDQICAFLSTFAIGVVGGFCYDYYRAVRRTFRLKKVGTFIGDIIFWLVTTALVFFLLLVGNGGVVRYYVLIGLGLGACIYFQSLSRTMSKLVWFKFFLLKKIWNIIVITIMFLFNTVLLPFRLMLLVLSYPIKFLRVLFNKASRRLILYYNNLVMKYLRRYLVRLKSIMSCLVFWKGKDQK